MSEYKENTMSPELMETMSEGRLLADASQKSENTDDEPKIDSIPFWSSDPNILLKQPYLLEFFPVENMTYNQKLNAISRSVIILGLVGFFLTTNIIGLSEEGGVP